MEEERTCKPVPDDLNQGVVRFLRNVPPANYSVKIESFSRLVKSGERYTSSMFRAGGYTWRLIIYPNGNKKRGGEDHVSLYLAIENTNSLPLGWEAYVTYKMFVFDHVRDQYLTIQDDPVHQIRRFHRAKKEIGFDRLISLDTFNAATNGYLVDDSCVFGVEVHEIKNTGKGEIIKVFDYPLEFTFDWKISEFSKVRKKMEHHQKLVSEEFTCGESKWTLLLYPNGDSRFKDCLSLFIELVQSPATWKKVSVEYSMVIMNQLSDCDHQHRSEERWFSTDSTTEYITSGESKGWGYANFMPLSKLTKGSGFIVNDTMLIQAKVKIKTAVTSFSLIKPV